MASNTSLNPKCSECSELFTDPRMLPCLHSFCKKCIEKLIEEQESKQALTCPTCKEEGALPDGGVDAIPQDIRAAYEAKAKEIELKVVNSSTEKCGRCVRTGNGPVVSFCINCDKFLCKICKEDHTQWLRDMHDHKLVDTGEKKEGKQSMSSVALPKKPIPCGQHGDEVLKFFCKTCETLICRDCITLEHNGHTYNRLEKVAEEEKADLLKTMEGANDAKLKLESAMGKREKLMQQIEQRKKAVDEAITDGFKQLYKALKEREEALLAQSTEIGLGKTSTLAIESDQLRKMRDQIDKTCSRISEAAAMYTPTEILSTKKVMKNKLLALLKKFQEATLEPTEGAMMPVCLDISPLLAEVATLGAVTGGSCPWMSMAVIYIPRATVDKERKIKVIARDEAGKSYTHGGEAVKGSLTLLGSSDPPVEATTTDNGDGTYIISFTPTTAGEHELKITINGHQIKHSPLLLSVHQGRAYRSISTCQRSFNTSANPWDVAVHDSGDLYVAASGAHNVYVLAPDGTYKQSLGTRGSGQGQFSGPSGIAIHGDVVYVAENGNNRVQKLTITGEHLAFIGTGELRNPRGICLDPEGKIFIADYSNHQVQVFNEDGTHAYSITGTDSFEGGNFNYPWGIAFDSGGKLHVASYGSRSIQIFTVEGQYVSTYGSGNFTQPPAGITVDTEGYSFVTEYCQYSANTGAQYGYNYGYSRQPQPETYGKLHIFDPSHQWLRAITCTNGYFNYPAGVTIDKEGFLWVADSSNNVIKKL